MAALDFPNSGLTTGTTYTGDNGTVYIYDGVKWVGQTSSLVGGIGATGPQGPSGLNGATGPQGPAGADGPTGPSGADSIVPGPTGPSGAAGPTGPLGGPSGPSGLSGPSGPAGTNGAIGPQGPSGLVGPAGPTGPQGDPSILPGPTGPSGPSGAGLVTTGTPNSLAYYNVGGTDLLSVPNIRVDTSTNSLLVGSNFTDLNLFIARHTYSAAIGQGLSFAQYHDTADAVNFTFLRSRGTASLLLPVQNNDDIGDIGFSAWNGLVYTASAGISATVEGSVSTSTGVPTKISFATNNGSGVPIRAELSSTGTWKIDKLSHLSTLTSYIGVNSNLIPSANLAYDLGSTSSEWNRLHVGSARFSDGTIQTTAYTGITWSLSASGTSDYVFSGPGIVTGNTNDPVLYLYRGFTYTFVNTAGGSHPLAIRVSNGGADYTDGVSGSQTGTQTFTVPMNAPSTLYYQCTNHSVMGNVINIV